MFGPSFVPVLYCSILFPFWSAIISLGKRELVIIHLLCSECYVALIVL